MNHQDLNIIKGTKNFMVAVLLFAVCSFTLKSNNEASDNTSTKSSYLLKTMIENVEVVSHTSNTNQVEVIKSVDGIASYYHNKFIGRRTATGEIFSQEKYTCACNKFPLNSFVRVTNLSNNKSVILRVNDRLAHNNKRVVDLTLKASKTIGSVQSGLAKVKVELLSSETGKKLLSVQK